MQIFIGCDIVCISRFMRHLQKTPALKYKLFSTNEFDLKPASLSARFAAKEALIKAIGDIPNGFCFNKTEILKKENGRPYFNFLSDNLSDFYQAYNLDISISHDADYAFASVVAYK